MKYSLIIGFDPTLAFLGRLPERVNQNGMRPEGQLKIDAALPDSNNKPSARLTDPQGWGDANLRPPGAPRGVKKRSETVPLPLGAPPPPAGVGIEEEADPVAGLFANDRIVPAPGIHDSPNEAEIGRWVATAHTSLFDDRVKDPAPAGMEGAANNENDELRPSTLEMIDQHLDQPAIPGMTEPLLAAPRKARAAAPVQAAVPAAAAQAPAAAAPAAVAAAAPAAPALDAPAPAAKARAGSASGARKRAALAAAASPAASEPESSAQDEDASELKARKRRIERGPSKAMLAGLGAATFIALGVAAVLLGVLPNPLAPSAAPVAPAPQQARGALPVHAKPVAQEPAAAPKTDSKPAVATSPLAAVKTPAAATKAAKSAAPAPAVVAPVAAAPVAAATVARASAPQARVAAPAPAATPAAVPVRAEPADSDGDESEAGGGSAKLAQARKLLSAENPEGAEALARQVLAGDPQDHHAMDVLARALMDQGRGADALPIARKMVQRRGKRVQYRLLLGDLLLMVGNAAEARAEWHKALELAPNDGEIKRRLN